MSTTFKLFGAKMGGNNAATYIGKFGEIFYDPTSGALRISDGETPGGRSVELAEAAAQVPITSILHVDVNREDEYGQTGSIFTPFKSIQAALDVVGPNSTILVAPGTYQENLTIPDLDGLAIIGSSEMNTTIINDGDEHTITWVPQSTSINKFALKYFTVVNDAGNHTIHIDAAAVGYPNTFCADEFDITEVDFDGDMYFRNTGVVYWNHGDCEGHLYITNCATFRTRNIEVGSLTAPKNIYAYYEGDDDMHNGIGRSDYTFATGTVIFGDLVLQGHPIIQLDHTSLVLGNIDGTALTSFYSSGRDYCPLFSLYGQIGLAGGGQGNITLNFPQPQSSGSAYNLVDLSNAMIAGSVTLSKAAYLPVNSRGLAYVQGDASYDKGTSNSITVNGAVVLDLKNANYQQAALNTSSTGFVDRNTITVLAAGATTAGATINILPQLPTGATYSATATPTSNNTVWITNKGATSFKLYSASGTPTADVTLHRI